MTIGSQGRAFSRIHRSSSKDSLSMTRKTSPIRPSPRSSRTLTTRTLRPQLLPRFVQPFYLLVDLWCPLLLFLRLVPSSGVATMVIDGSLSSSSVIRRLCFQSNHYHVSVYNINPICPSCLSSYNSIHPPCSRSSSSSSSG